MKQIYSLYHTFNFLCGQKNIVPYYERRTNDSEKFQNYAYRLIMRKLNPTGSKHKKEKYYSKIPVMLSDNPGHPNNLALQESSLTTFYQ
jgi:hypothetical protein